MIYHRPAFVCACSHLRRVHVNTKSRPNGPCTECAACPGFTPEPVCKCGHGKKAHQKSPTGHCHECDCKVMRPVA